MAPASLCEICEAPILRRSAGRTASTCCSPPCRIKRRKEAARIRAQEWRRANPEAAVERNRRYREANKELDAARKRAYALANAEREAARKKAWYKANRERIRSAWASRTPEQRAEDVKRVERWRRANPQRWAEQSRKYGRDHPERVAAKVERRRARMSMVSADLVLLGDLLVEQEFACYLCQEVIDPACKFPDSRSPSVDHVVPLSRGGSGLRDNLRAAHLGCNCWKGTRLLEELVTA